MFAVERKREDHAEEIAKTKEVNDSLMIILNIAVTKKGTKTLQQMQTN